MIHKNRHLINNNNSQQNMHCVDFGTLNHCTTKPTSMYFRYDYIQQTEHTHNKLSSKWWDALMVWLNLR